MDLRMEIKQRGIDNEDAFDKSIFDRWLNGEIINKEDYEFILDKMQESIDHENEFIDKFYFYDILDKRYKGRGWMIFHKNLDIYPKEFAIFIKEKEYQNDLKQLNEVLESLGMNTLNYNLTEKDVVSTIMEIFYKYKNGELVYKDEGLKFTFNLLDRIKNKDYLHIKKYKTYESTCVETYIMYVIMINELKKKNTLWFHEYYELFREMKICSFDDDYQKVCNNYEMKYDKDKGFIYIDDDKYEESKNEIDKYKNLSKEIMSVIFESFKEEFLLHSTLLSYGSKENQERIKTLESVIDSLFIKNPDWKYRNINFYVIESMNLPHIIVLYESLLFQFTICVTKDENGLAHWKFKLRKGYSYIDKDKECKLTGKDATMDIDLSLPNISQSKKASVGNSAMIGGLLFGTAGAIVGASSAIEKNAKIAAFNANNTPIIHTAKYKEYSLTFTISGGTDKYSFSSVRRKESITQLQELDSKINSTELSYTELIKKLKNSNNYVIDKLNEEYTNLYKLYKEKNTELSQYKHAIIGNKLRQKNLLNQEISKLESKLVYIKKFLEKI